MSKRQGDRTNRWFNCLGVAALFSCFSLQTLQAAEQAKTDASRDLRSPSPTIVIPGKPSEDRPFGLVSQVATKLSHKRLHVGDYTFVPHVNKLWGVDRYKILRGNTVVHEEKISKQNPNNTYYTVVLPLIPSRKVAIPETPNRYAAKLAIKGPLKAFLPGYSICSSGTPEIAVEFADCGAARCLYKYTFFSCGKQFKKLLTLDTENDDLTFIDLDGNGTIEAVGRDSTFRFWNAYGCNSPSPLIILKLKPGKATLADNLMKTPPPSPRLMAKMIAETQAALKPETNASQPASDLIELKAYPVFAYMLDLIYTGNAQAAWTYLDQIWPQKPCRYENSDQKPPTKQEFLRDFKKQLAKSPYWNDIKRLNNFDPSLN